MGNHEFQGSLYRNEREMLDAIAYAWVGGGDADHEYMREIMAEISDEDLAAECIASGWDTEPEDGDKRRYIDGDLVLAFTRLRERLEAE